MSDTSEPTTTAPARGKAAAAPTLLSQIANASPEELAAVRKLLGVEVADDLIDEYVPPVAPDHDFTAVTEGTLVATPGIHDDDVQGVHRTGMTATHTVGDDGTALAALDFEPAEPTPV